MGISLKLASVWFFCAVYLKKKKKEEESKSGHKEAAEGRVEDAKR